MSEKALWAILMPTLTCREMDTILALEDQIFALPDPSRVIICQLMDDGAESIGAKRNKLLKEGCEKAEYVSFFDDDDIPEANFVANIVNLLTDEKPDMVGIMLKYFVSGKFVRLEPLNSHRVTHLNPIKASIAGKFQFPDIDSGEDVIWQNQVRPHIQTQLLAQSYYKYMHEPIKPHYEQYYRHETRDHQKLDEMNAALDIEYTAKPSGCGCYRSKGNKG